MERCGACGSVVLAERGAVKPEAPREVLPFRASAERVRARAVAWASEGGLTEPAFARAATGLVVTPLWIPIWLGDATASSTWWTEVGKELAKGGVSWTPKSGKHNNTWRDIPVAAVDTDWGRALDAAVSEACLASSAGSDRPLGTVLLEPTIGERAAESSLVKQVTQLHERECRDLIASPQSRNFRQSVDVRRPSLRMVWLPLWMCTFEYRGQQVQFYVDDRSLGLHGWVDRPVNVRLALQLVGGLFVAVGALTASVFVFGLCAGFLRALSGP